MAAPAKLWIGNLPPGEAQERQRRVYHTRPEEQAQKLALACLFFWHASLLSTPTAHALQASPTAMWRRCACSQGCWACHQGSCMARRRGSCMASGQLGPHDARAPLKALAARTPATPMCAIIQACTSLCALQAFSKYGMLRNCWVARKPPGFGFGECITASLCIVGRRGLGLQNGSGAEQGRLAPLMPHTPAARCLPAPPSTAGAPADASHRPLPAPP